MKEWICDTRTRLRWTSAPTAIQTWTRHWLSLITFVGPPILTSFCRIVGSCCSVDCRGKHSLISIDFAAFSTPMSKDLA